VNPKKSVRGEATSQDEKMKEMKKFKCFSFHNFGHYASQCLNKKKGEGKA